MGVVEQSHETVEGYLTDLEEVHDSFSINQTTLAVSPSRYQREREKAAAGQVDLYVRVRNDDSKILHVQREDAVELPSTSTTDDAFERAATDAVKERTGVDCHVVGIAQATILGVRNGDATDPDTVYRLALLFEARQQAGTATANAVWKQTEQRTDPVYV